MVDRKREGGGVNRKMRERGWIEREGLDRERGNGWREGEREQVDREMVRERERVDRGRVRERDRR